MQSENPFSSDLFDPRYDRDIFFYILELRLTEIIYTQFNPWYHRLPNYLLSLLPSLPKRRYDYIVDDDDNLIWYGLNRRKRPRSLMVDKTVSIFKRMRRLPKTLKVRTLA